MKHLNLIFFVGLFFLNSCAGQINNNNSNVETPEKAEENKKRKKLSTQKMVEESEKEALKIKGNSKISFYQSDQTTIELDAAKVPVKGFRVKLFIKNNHNVDMWYLMPGSGSNSMPSTGLFETSEQMQSLMAFVYSDASKELIEVEFKGVEGHSFRAFFVPAGGSILFRNYDVGVYKRGETVPFWAVRGLNMNHTIPIQEWVQQNLKSSNGVQVQQLETQPQLLELSVQAPHEKTKLQCIQASIHRKHKIPVESLP